MKAINWALAVLAIIAAALCGYMGYQYYTFPAQDYAAQVEDIDAREQSLREDIAVLEAELAARDAVLREDLSQAGTQGAAAAEELAALKEELTRSNERLAALRERADFLENIQDNTLALRHDYALKIRELEDLIVAGESDVKICYWTFDDGPSYYTSEFLDAVEELGVYVTFFTSREANHSAYEDDPAVERALLRREAAGGNAICNHSWSHQYSKVAGNLYTQGIDSFREMVVKQDEWIYECTGMHADIFRFPGGSAWAFSGPLSKDELVGALEELGYQWIDWSCNTYDAGAPESWPTAAGEAAEAVRQISSMDIAMILSHDMYPHTLGAFQRAVPLLQEMGYVFLPLFSESWTIGNTSIIFK